MSLAGQIEDLLTQKLSACRVEVNDESGRHRGHAGAMQGGGHYSVTVVSDLFTGKSLIERHRAIYDALEPLGAQIHALAIKAYTTGETEKLK